MNGGRSPIEYRLLLLFVLSLALMKNWDLPLVHRKLQVSDLVFLALTAVVLARHRRAAWSTLPAGAWMVVAFPLGLLPSFLSTRALGLSSIQFAGFLYLVAVYWAIHLLVTDETLWWGVVRVWFWTALGVIGIAWVGWLLSRGLGVANPFLRELSDLDIFKTRFLSTFHHPGMLAAYLNASLAPLFLYLRRRRFSKVFIGAVLAVVALTAINTKARVSAGVVLSSALLWHWCIPSPSRVSRWVFAWAAAGMAALALVTCVWWVLPLRPAPGLGGLSLMPNKDHSPYFYFHSAALRIGLDHPWTGVGLEQYNSHMLTYIDWEQARSGFYWTDPESTEPYHGARDPHSTYLGYWAEAGLPGVLGLGVLLGGLLWTFWSKTRRPPSLIPSVFMAVLLGFAFNAYYLDIMTLRVFWAVVALGTVALDKGIHLSGELPA